MSYKIWFGCSFLLVCAALSAGCEDKVYFLTGDIEDEEITTGDDGELTAGEPTTSVGENTDDHTEDPQPACEDLDQDISGDFPDIALRYAIDEAIEKILQTGERFDGQFTCGEAQQLTELLVNGRFVTSTMGIRHLINLKTLDLTDNWLTKIDDIHTLEQLEVLRLSHNKIHVLNALPPLGKLKTLSAASNDLTALPDLSKHSSLELLNLDRNSIESVDQLHGLATLTKLHTLGLGANKLLTLQSFPDLPSLRTLHIQNNQLKNLTGLPSLPQLEALHASSNLLTSVAGLPNLPKLLTLDLSGNQLQSLAGLPALPQLNRLDLSFNALADFEILGKLSLLDWLSLSANSLSSAQDLPGLPKLTFLDLSQNNVNDLGGLADKFPLLDSLDLSDNGIWSLKDFPPLPTLRLLDLSSLEDTQNPNIITTLVGLPSLPGLHKLLLGGNLLQNDAGLDALQGTPSLDWLELQSNFLSSDVLLKLSTAQFSPWLSPNDGVNITDNPIDCDDAATTQALANFAALGASVSSDCK